MNVDFALLVLRVTVGAVIAAHGLMKLGWIRPGGSVGGLAAWLGSIGIRPAWFWAVVATLAESVGGVLTIVGLGGPLGPGLVAADLVVVTIVAHLPQGFWVAGGKSGIEFPAPLAAGAFAIALIGNGRWSLDVALGLAYPEWLLPAWLALMVIGVLLALSSRAVYAREQTPQKAA